MIFDNLIEGDPNSENYGKPIEIEDVPAEWLETIEEAGRRGGEAGLRFRSE